MPAPEGALGVAPAAATGPTAGGTAAGAAPARAVVGARRTGAIAAADLGGRDEFLAAFDAFLVLFLMQRGFRWLEAFIIALLVTLLGAGLDAEAEALMASDGVESWVTAWGAGHAGNPEARSGR